MGTVQGIVPEIVLAMVFAGWRGWVRTFTGGWDSGDSPEAKRES
jgi:hypothetical protein